MSIVVMVDSSANLSKSLLNKYDISVLPYNVIFKNGDCYKDFYDIKNLNELQNKIDEYGQIPRIDQVSMIQIENYFRKIIDKGDDILYIGVSSYLSNAYNEVLEVSKKFDPSTIEVIDSLNVGVGETLLAMYAKDYINKGYGLKQTARYINDIKTNIKSCYTIGNLRSLNRDCIYLNDSMDFFKCFQRVPMGEIDKGKIILTSSTKDKELAIQVLKNTIVDFSKNMANDHLILSYSGNRSDASAIKNYVNKHFKECKVEMVENSNVVYINTGMNTLSLAFLLNKK